MERKNKTIISLHSYLKDHVNKLSDDTLKDLHTKVLNKGHPANQSQILVSHKKSSNSISLKGLAEFPVPKVLRDQLKSFAKQNSINEHYKSNLAKCKRKPGKNNKYILKKTTTQSLVPTDSVPSDPSLSTEDIRSLNETSGCPIHEVTPKYMSTSLTKQWSPEALERAIVLLKLNNDIKQSHSLAKSSTHSKRQKEANRKRLLQPNFNDRLQKLKGVSHNYKSFLIDSINYKLMMQRKPSSLYSTSTRIFPMKSFVTAETVLSPGRTHQTLVSPSQPIGNIRRASTKLLAIKKAAGDDTVRKELEEYFLNNPITKSNFHRAQVVNKEIGYLANILGQKETRNRKSVISMFEKRHKALKYSVLASTSATAPLICYQSRGEEEIHVVKDSVVSQFATECKSLANKYSKKLHYFSQDDIDRRIKDLDSVHN